MTNKDQPAEEELVKLMRDAADHQTALEQWATFGSEYGMSEARRDEVLRQRVIDSALHAESDEEALAIIDNAAEGVVPPHIIAEAQIAITEIRDRKMELAQRIISAPSETFGKTLYELARGKEYGISEKALGGLIADSRLYRARRAIIEKAAEAETQKEVKALIKSSPNLTEGDKEEITQLRYEAAREKMLFRAMNAETDDRLKSIVRGAQDLFTVEEIPALLEQRKHYQEATRNELKKTRLVEKMLDIPAEEDAIALFEAEKAKGQITLTDIDLTAALEQRSAYIARTLKDVRALMNRAKNSDAAIKIFDTKVKQGLPLTDIDRQESIDLYRETVLNELLSKMRFSNTDNEAHRYLAADERITLTDDETKELLDHRGVREEATVTPPVISESETPEESPEHTDGQDQAPEEPTGEEKVSESKHELLLQKMHDLMVESETDDQAFDTYAFLYRCDPSILLSEGELEQISAERRKRAGALLAQKLEKAGGSGKTLAEFHKAKEKKPIQLSEAEIAGILKERVHKEQDALRQRIREARTDSAAEKEFEDAIGKRHELHQTDFEQLMEERAAKRATIDSEKNKRTAREQDRLRIAAADAREAQRIREGIHLLAPGLIKETEQLKRSPEEQERADFTRGYIEAVLIDPLTVGQQELMDTVPAGQEPSALIKKYIAQHEEKIAILQKIQHDKNPDIALLRAVKEGKIPLSVAEVSQFLTELSVWQGQKRFEEIMEMAGQKIKERVEERRSLAGQVFQAISIVAKQGAGKKREKGRREYVETTAIADYLRSRGVSIDETIEENKITELRAHAQYIIEHPDEKEERLASMTRQESEFVTRVITQFELNKPRADLIDAKYTLWEGTESQAGLQSALAEWLQCVPTHKQEGAEIALPKPLIEQLNRLIGINHSLEELGM